MDSSCIHLMKLFCLRRRCCVSSYLDQQTFERLQCGHCCMVLRRKAITSPTHTRTQDWDYYLPLDESGSKGMDAQITTLNLPLIGVIERVQGMLGTTAAAGFVEMMVVIMER